MVEVVEEEMVEEEIVVEMEEEMEVDTIIVNNVKEALEIEMIDMAIIIDVELEMIVVHHSIIIRMLNLQLLLFMVIVRLNEIDLLTNLFEFIFKKIHFSLIILPMYLF